jgi:hypothetical protein
MNKNLQKAVERDKRIPQQISPISSFDAAVFNELIEIVKKLEEQELVEILNSYKKKKDEEIFELLLEWNTNFRPKLKIKEEEGNTENRGGFKRNFISINKDEIIIDIYRIGLIIKDQYYNRELTKIIYQIIVNPGETEDLYTNIIIDFENKKNRDKEIDRLKDKLKDFKITIY